MEPERINYELIFVIIIILLLLGWFVGKPLYEIHIKQKQLEAQELFLYNMLLKIQNNGYIDVPFDDRVIRLIPVKI